MPRDCMQRDYMPRDYMPRDCMPRDYAQRDYAQEKKLMSLMSVELVYIKVIAYLATPDIDAGVASVEVATMRYILSPLLRFLDKGELNLMGPALGSITPQFITY